MLFNILTSVSVEMDRFIIICLPSERPYQPQCRFESNATLKVFLNFYMARYLENYYFLYFIMLF